MSAATSWASVEWCMRRFIKTVNDSHCCCCCYSLLDLTRSHRRVKQTHTQYPPYPLTPLPNPLQCALIVAGLTECALLSIVAVGAKPFFAFALPPLPSLPLFTSPSSIFAFSLPVSYALSYNYARSLPDAVDLCLSSPAWPPLFPLPTPALPPYLPYYVPKRFPAQSNRIFYLPLSSLSLSSRSRPAWAALENNKRKKKK